MDYAEKIGRELQRSLTEAIMSGREPAAATGLFRAAAMLIDEGWSRENCGTEAKIASSWRATYRQMRDVDVEDVLMQAQAVFLSRLPDSVRDALRLEVRREYGGM